jgi:opacity protein-like surface antigen
MVNSIKLSATAVILYTVQMLGTAAFAGESHLETRIGGTYIEDIQHTDGAIQSEEEYRTGFAAEIIWDHRYNNNFRIITSVSYHRTNFDKINIIDDGGWGVFYTGTSWNGETLRLQDSKASVWSGWLKGAYDIDINEKVGVFLGAGVGASSINVTIDDFGIDDSGGDDAALSWQGFAGATWALDAGTQLVAEYQYIVITDVETDYGFGPSSPFDVVAHGIFLGVRTSF